ncbi:bacillithiol system redox-active protein YtxJ [Roseivirga echinicomitans]|uniref:bacillithiol system redox-active protein YtxJ n=1 Tax=Roseivirga echinicomitans TaxID=296218 RepID=UPI000A8E3B97|nr:bacillithiol system redox-active protein YtxJ [Roseivirga echinicomitans]
MFWNKKKEDTVEVPWNRLERLDQISEIIEESKNQTVVIYKHSTRCSISSMALNRLERNWTAEGNQLKVYYLDLIQFREISNAIAEQFRVQHESPQAIVIKNSKAVHNSSHMSIDYDAMLKLV